MTSYIKYPGNAHVILKAYIQQFGWNYYILFLTSAILLSVLFAYFFIVKKPDKPFLFYCITISFVVFFRLPTLVMYSYDPDESQFITAINALLNDSRYWQSADMYTSGPLNIMPLVLLYKTGIPLNYFTLRLIMIVCIQLPTIFLLYKTCCVIADKQKAALALFPVMLFYAFMNNQELISFNSEQIPNLLTAFAVLLLVKNYYRNEKNELLTGIVLGSMLFTKLQYAPVGFFLGLTSLTILYLRKRKLQGYLLLITGVFIPILLTGIYLLVSDSWSEFYISYILVNLVISKTGLTGGEPFPYNLLNLPLFIYKSPEFAFLILLCSLLLLAFFARYFYSGRNFSVSYKTILFGAVYFIISCWCIVQNGNKFLHYIYLLVVPCSLLIFWSIRYLYTTPHFATVCIAFSIFFTGVKIFKNRYFIYDILETKITPLTPLSAYINSIDRPNEKIAVWGWNTSVYVETENIQATRDPHTYNQIAETPYRSYFEERYADDLKKNKPEIIIDGVPDLFFKDTTDRINHYPLISNYIYAHYTLTDTIGNNRIYIRKD
jgi:hypothetical protein